MPAQKMIERDCSTHPRRRRSPTSTAMVAGLAVMLAGPVHSQPRNEAPTAAGDYSADRAAVQDEQFQLGAAVFMQGRCFVCHGEQGFGGAGPRFRENRFLGLEDYVVGQVLVGRKIMPSFADTLSDEQIAAVATYIRNAWGNKFGSVGPEQVATARQRMQLVPQPGRRPELPPTAQQPEGAPVPPYSPLPPGQPLPPRDLGQAKAEQSATSAAATPPRQDAQGGANEQPAQDANQ